MTSVRLRLAITVSLVLAFGAACWFAVDAASLRATDAFGRTGQLLIDRYGWLPLIPAAGGVLVASLVKRKPIAPARGRVVRHDGFALLEHWMHAIGTIVLLVSGFVLGFLGIDRSVSTVEQVAVAMNLHFVAIVPFLFGCMLHSALQFVSTKSGEHLPVHPIRQIKDAALHYKAIFLRTPLPPSEKYFASERLTYPIPVVGSFVVIITGAAKVLAHEIDLPAQFMGWVTVAHDVAGVALGLYLVIHVIMGALVPWSWPLMGSMLTGWVTEDYARHHHLPWYESIVAQTASTAPAPIELAIEIPIEIPIQVPAQPEPDAWTPPAQVIELDIIETPDDPESSQSTGVLYRLRQPADEDATGEDS